MPTYGKTSGMTILEFYAYLFDLNTRVKTKKLSDQEIAIRVLQEFPHRKNVLNHLTTVSKYRSAFNAGRLHKRYAAPRVPLFKYINGVAVNRNKKIYQGHEIRQRMRKQLPRWRKDNARKIKEELKPRKEESIRQGVRKAHKRFKERLKLQKEMARLYGLPTWAE